MIAPRASVQLGISMPAIDVFWLNHPMAILPREAASVGGLLSYSTDSPMVGLSGLRAVGGEPVHDLGIGATVIGQERHAIATSAAAFGAVNVQRIELADEITKYGTVAGHRLFSD